ncbi:MAG TPA: calcium-binding protein, partial [Tabrizicola sp.]|nr:calcium-binding protein [Tabrizicola sp.]
SRAEGLPVVESYYAFFEREQIISTDRDEIILSDGSERTITFAPGSGHDVIYDAARATLVFSGYTFADAQIARDPLNPGNLIVNFAGTSDRIEIIDGLTNERPSSIVFADRSLSSAQLIQHLLDHQITLGDDVVNADFGNTTVAGLTGDDVIDIGNGADLVRFSRGDGQDEVQNRSYYDSSFEADRLEIAGYSAADLIVERHPTDLDAVIFRFAGTSDQIVWRSVGTYDEGTGPQPPLSLTSIRFTDTNQTLTKAQILALLPPLPPINGSADGEFIYGTPRGELITGGAGDDTILAGTGNDTIVFGTGDGTDIILGREEAVGWNDVESGIRYPDGSITLRLRGLNPEDVRFEAAAEDQPVRIIIQATGEELQLQNHVRIIARVEFADGTIWNGDQVAANLTVTTPPEEAYVPRGYELLPIANGVTQLSAAADEYLSPVWDSEAASLTYGIEAGRSTGHDLVPVFNSPPNAAIAVSLTDVSSTDVQVRVFGNEMVLTYPGSDASLTLLIYPDFPEYYAGVQVTFSDSVTLDLPALLALATTLAASDPARAQGALVYDRATMSGSYWLEDVVGAPLQLDVSGIPSEDISYAVRGDLLVVTIAADASTGLGAGIVHIPYGPSGYGLELIADGATVATLSQILTQVAAAIATTGDDRIETFGYTSVTVEGGLGNDTYLAGSSTTDIVYTRGDGNDLVITSYNLTNLRLQDIAPEALRFERQGSDIVMLIAETAPGAGDGGSIRFRDQYSSTSSLPPGTITFDDQTQLELSSVTVTAPSGDLPRADGTQVAIAPPGGARFELGLGDDVAIGRGGDDTFVYRNGDGHDLVREKGGSSQDMIQLPDLAATDLEFQRDGEDLVILVVADAVRGIQAGSIRVENAFLFASVELVSLADGTDLPLSTILQSVIADQITSGNDFITGSNLADTLDGGDGDDLLVGRDGADTYVYSRGGGHDQIAQIVASYSSTPVREDRLVLHGISADAITAALTVNGLLLTIAPSATGGDGGSVLIRADMRSGTGFAIQSVLLDNGAELTLSDLLQQAVAAADTAGGDYILGADLAQTLAGGLGNDTLAGQGGGDTYLYARGDGIDVIDDNSFGSEPDVLRLAGILPS